MKQVLYFQTKFLAEKQEKMIGEKKMDIINIKGFASTGDVDRVRDKVLPTAFTETLPLYLKTGTMLLQHDDNKVIGKFNDGVIKSNGLEVSGDVMYDIDECMQKILDGVLGAFSIGFITQAYQYEDEMGHILYKSDEGLMAGYDWDSLYDENVIRVITKVDLVEVSIVSTPCNPYALFQVAKDFFVEETKKLKSLATQKKGAPNEFDEADKNESNPTDGEDVASETLAIEEEKTLETEENPIDTPAEEEKTEVVKVDEEIAEVSENGISEDEAKTLIAEAVEIMRKELSEAFEAQIKSLSDTNSEIKSTIAEHNERTAKIEKDILGIEISRPMTAQSQKGLPVVTDAMVLKTLGRK